MAEVSERKATKKNAKRRDYAAVLRKVETYCTVAIEIYQRHKALNPEMTVTFDASIETLKDVLARINGDAK